MKQMMKERVLGAKCLVLGAAIAALGLASSAKAAVAQNWMDAYYPGQGWTVSSVEITDSIPNRRSCTVVTHPLGSDASNSPAVLSCTMKITGLNPKLRLSVRSHSATSADWVLSAKVNDDQVLSPTTINNPTVARVFTIPLDKYLGQTVTIQLLNGAGGGTAWLYEYAYWDSIEFIGMANVEITGVTQTLGSGKATVNYKVSGLKSKTDLVITACANGNSTSKRITDVTDGTGSTTIDYKTALGVSPNVAFSAVLTNPDAEGVQLWANGPYWATCNVGASSPSDAGYFFWWGDTVGYTPNGAWYPVSGTTSTYIGFSTANVFPSNKTWNKAVSTLTSNGYLDSSGNLASWCDAATAHLGAPWRMPTRAEMQALIDNCTATWTSQNGVYGRLFRGTGDYESKSIFVPAAGYGNEYAHGDFGIIGDYWSSTPCNNTEGAYMMQHITSETLGVGACDRRFGFPVRAVRTFTD